MENKTVFCPVLQRQVNGDDCFDISMVAEKTTPDRFLPKDLKPEDFTDGKKAVPPGRRTGAAVFYMKKTPPKG